MIFSKKCIYGIQAMLEMVPAYPAGWVPVNTISEKTEVSRKFLDQLLLQLNRADILKSKMGRDGGYALNQPPEQITIEHIVDVLNGSVCLGDCSRKSYDCDRKGACKVYQLIDDAETVLKDFLNTVTLRSLYEKQISKGALSYTI